MRLLAGENDDVALNALCAENDAERKIQLFEHRTLLDVQLQVGRRVLALLFRFRETADFHPAAPQSVLHLHAVAVRARAIRRNRMRPGERRGTEQTASKTSPFLVSPIHETDRNRGPAVEL